MKTFVFNPEQHLFSVMKVLFVNILLLNSIMDIVKALLYLFRITDDSLLETIDMSDLVDSTGIF